GDDWGKGCYTETETLPERAVIARSGATKQSPSDFALGFLSRFGDRGGPRRHHIADAVIEPVLAAHHEVRAGEALRPHRVLDELGAAPRAEPLADCIRETAIDRDPGVAADVDAG